MHVLVTVCPVLSSCHDQSFQQSVLIADAAAHRERLATIGKAKLLSPSSYGKLTGDESWSAPKVQSIQEAMCHHRPACPSEEQPTPIVLFDSILAQLAEDCETATPSKADCKFAAEVSEAMSETFANSTIRRDAFWALLRKEFCLTLEQAKYGEWTDGSRKHRVGMLVNIVVKNELGSGGGAAHVQNAAYAAAHAFQDGMNREISVCPTLLIELAGPNMSFSGAVFADRAICDQLTPMVSLLWQPHSPLMLQAARCFTALRAALLSLRFFYDFVYDEAQAKRPLQRQLLSPYPAAFTDLHNTHTQVQLTYTGKLGRLCFKGVVDQMGCETPVFVKFCRSYCREAHDILASRGFAPTVLGLKALPGGWFMVVMQFADGCQWDESASKPAKALQDAVQVLHEAGFVHGDLRSNTILVVQHGVHIVDFEWAGIANQATYPFFMNHTDLTWPDGASDGLPITKEHDLSWLQSLVQV